MLKLSYEKYKKLERISTKGHIINALAIDQRGALKKIFREAGLDDAGNQGIVNFKKIVSEELTDYVSAILLDPEYGLPAAKLRSKNSGLLISYEKTGYDACETGRLPHLLPGWSALRIKDEGADSVKILLYYDAGEDAAINDRKHAFVERVGSECKEEDMPFFLEIVTYDAVYDGKSSEYIKLRPHKVIDAMKEFSKPRYKVDVLKVEAPVDMNYVEGYDRGKIIFSRAEAEDYFRQQSQATDLPFIFLSGGVSSQLFQETLKLAAEAGSTFNGVLCGRATWKEGASAFASDGEEAGRHWIQTQGRKNIENLNAVLSETAVPWDYKVAIE